MDRAGSCRGYAATHAFALTGTDRRSILNEIFERYDWQMRNKISISVILIVPWHTAGGG